ncbi:MAG: hypothetical protein IMZ53_11775 [Thermoplasmata archaeon]|nr:hypothetical protein [Thermoplasmata archaeon]
MRESGYSKASSQSGQQYERLRKHLKKIDYFAPEQIKKDVMTVFRMAKKVKDVTNLNRNLEHRAKIAGMITEKQEIAQVDKDTNQFSLDRLSKIKQCEN